MSALFGGGKKSEAVAPAPTPAQVVDPSIALGEQNANKGRATLISTSSQGVLGTDPTGRRKVLGN